MDCSRDQTITVCVPIMAAHAPLEALLAGSLRRIVRELAIVEGGSNGLHILPLVSRTLA